MNHIKNKIRDPIPLSDVKWCPGAGNYYHKFRGTIADIKTSDEGNQILSALYVDFKRYSRAYPREDKEIAKTYQLLKRKCLEAMRECDWEK